MKFKIKIIITIMVSFVVIVSMSLFIVNSNSISISGFNSDTVITGSNNSYLITLKGVPSGNGTYQQLLTLNNYSKYGINDKGSNIAFYDGNNLTHLYAWIQSINITTIQIWIKNFNDSSKIDMQVLSSFENLFTVNGYLGYGKTYFNALYVFPDATNFSSEKGLVETNAGSGTIIYGANGVNMTHTNDPTNIFFNKTLSGNIIMFVEGSYSADALGVVMTTNITPYGDLFVGNGYEIGSRAGNPGANNIFYLNESIGGVQIAGNGNLQVNITNAIKGVYDTNGSLQYYINGSLNGQTVNNSYPSNNLIHIGITSFAFESYSYVNYQYLIAFTVSNSMPTFTIVSLYHSIDFKLLGSPFSSLWNIMVNGTTYQADSSNIYLNMTNGYYNIIVNLPAGYSAITKGVLYVNGTNQVYKIFVSYNNNSGISNDIIYAIILASIIVAAAIYFSKRS